MPTKTMGTAISLARYCDKLYYTDGMITAQSTANGKVITAKWSRRLTVGRQVATSAVGCRKDVALCTGELTTK